MRTEPHTIPAHATVESAVEDYFLHYDDYALLVTDDGETLGVLRLDTVQRVEYVPNQPPTKTRASSRAGRRSFRCWRCGLHGRAYWSTFSESTSSRACARKMASWSSARPRARRTWNTIR